MLLVGVAAGSQADAVSVADEWAGARYVSIDNGAIGLVFSGDERVVHVYDHSKAQPVQFMSLAPYGLDGERATGTSLCKVLEASGNEARCEVSFSTEAGSMRVVFALNRRGAIRVQPLERLSGVSIAAPFRYGVLPSRHLDDDIYDANDYPESTHLQIPSENLFVGLLEGNDRILACVWPSGQQSVRLTLSGPKGERRIESLELGLAGTEAFIGALSAPGIWHEVALDASFEERDTVLEWRPPFEAVWKTQLAELGVPTTFTHLPGPKRQWRPTIGYYRYPFFTQDGNTILHLHKKLASQGRALIYALEGHRSTPYSFLTSNLPLEEQRKITELQAVVHYYALDPRPIPGGHIMAAHCSGRDQLKYTTLAVGAQAREIDFLDTHISDRVHECRVILRYSIRRALDRMEELDGQLERWLRESSGNPEVTSFLRGMRGTLSDMRQDYTARLGGDTPEEKVQHVERMALKYRATIREGAGLELCPEILFCINELNSIISLDEDECRRFGTWGRKLFQQAGYTCVHDPKAAEYARQLRASLREHMKYRQYETPRMSGYPKALIAGG